MTAAPKRFCSYPGCGVLVTSGMCDKHRTRQRYCKHPGCNQIVIDSNWCQAHEPQRRHDERRGGAAARGYDHTWSKLQRSYMREFPLCGRCEHRGRTRAAQMVHHIVAIRDGGPRLDKSNLLSLCWHCHGKVGGRGESIDQVMIYKRLYQTGSEAG